ncbi:hypothetical protein BpHYR1_045658 [Brachionus plicatilis]|uniref:Uncharacterized protein n=1 Tax=Brachionus plicatilis TaxID=10195 RepID=A0A3M7PIK7_BRAPC|nr:hypothetical protein BpHYR1_045658 [Brachionus plicatilis]
MSSCFCFGLCPFESIEYCLSDFLRKLIFVCLSDFGFEHTSQVPVINIGKGNEFTFSKHENKNYNLKLTYFSRFDHLTIYLSFVDFSIQQCVLILSRIHLFNI